MLTRAQLVRWGEDGGGSLDWENGRITIDFDGSKITVDRVHAVSKDSVERPGHQLIDAIK